jgi:hypothetical protein
MGVENDWLNNLLGRRALLLLLARQNLLLSLLEIFHHIPKMLCELGVLRNLSHTLPSNASKYTEKTTQVLDYELDKTKNVHHVWNE